MNDAQSKTHGGPNRGQGRKPLSTNEGTVTFCMRMTEPQRAKLELLGGAKWVRDRIQKAKPVS
jgi:hypothetical protein